MLWAKNFLNTQIVHPNAHLLDIGSRDGRITAMLANRLNKGTVLGIDSYQDMVKFAQRLFPQQLFGNLQFLHEDIQQKHFDASFDIVTSFFYLHWIQDYQRALQQMKKSLKERGKLILSVSIQGDPNLSLYLNEIIQMGKWSHFFQNYLPSSNFQSPQTYENILKQMGFQIEMSRIVSWQHDMEEKDYIGFLGGVLPHMKHIPLDRQHEFLKEFVDLLRYRNQMHLKSPFRFETKILEIVACKEK